MKFNIKSRKSIVITLVTSALICGGAWYLCDISKDSQTFATERSSNTNDEEFYTISASEKVYINGIVTPNQTETFYMDETLGEIEKINVSSGELVDKGHLLYTYKNAQKEQEVKEQEVELKSKEADLVLLKKDSGANAVDIKVLEKEISNLKKEIATLKEQVTTKVVAPFNGTVYLENELNDESSKGALITIDSRDCYLEGTVNEKDLAKLKTGMGTDLHIFSLNENRSGKVTYVSKRPANISSTSGLSEYKVRVEFDRQDSLVNGYHAQAKISISDEAITVPVSSIITEEEKQYVLLIQGGIVKKQEIEATIVENDTIATVTVGLNDKDVIVRDAKNTTLKDGDEINPENDSEGGEILDEIEF